MSAKSKGPPQGAQWVWLTRELIESDAWRSAGINARRLLDFLLIEHMAHAGGENGRLKAPYRQLVRFGIGARLVSAAIAEAEELGLILCHRGGRRVATSYALAWLPLHSGARPAEPWRAYRNPSLAPLPRPKNQKSASP